MIQMLEVRQQGVISSIWPTVLLLQLKSFNYCSNHLEIKAASNFKRK